MDIPVGLIILGIVLVFWLIVVIIKATYDGLCHRVARIMTPKSHRPMGEYRESEGYLALKKEGFDVTPNWSSSAMKSVKR